MSGKKLTKNFSAEEVSCKCGCSMLPTDSFMERLQKLRDTYGKPIKITSGARCASYNTKIGGAKSSYHTKGRAVDISVKTGPERYALLAAALSVGFRGIGLAKTFLHVDDRETPNTWFY